MLSHLFTLRLSSWFIAFFISRLGSQSPHSMAQKLFLGGMRYSSSGESSAAAPPLSAPVAPRVSFAIAPGLRLWLLRCCCFPGPAYREPTASSTSHSQQRVGRDRIQPNPAGSCGLALYCPEHRPPPLTSAAPPTSDSSRRLASPAGGRFGRIALRLRRGLLARPEAWNGGGGVAVRIGEVDGRSLRCHVEAAAHDGPTDPASVRW